MTGVEGYMESAACGIIASENMIRRLSNKAPLDLPDITMLGALVGYITDETLSDFQPMGANFGIIPSLPDRIKDKAERYTALSNRSLDWYSKNF